MSPTTDGGVADGSRPQGAPAALPVMARMGGWVKVWNWTLSAKCACSERGLGRSSPGHRQTLASGLVDFGTPVGPSVKKNTSC